MVQPKKHRFFIPFASHLRPRPKTLRTKTTLFSLQNKTNRMGADLQMNTRLTPGIQAMLPLLYAAWADRHLNLKEINALRKRAADLPFLTDEDKQLLLVWSDPARPPERELFQQWQTMGRNAAEQLPADRPASLAELGAILGHFAEGNAAERVDFWKAQVTPLLEIERGLGGVNAGTYRGLFPLYDQREKLFEAIEKATVDPAVIHPLVFTNLLFAVHAFGLKRPRQVPKTFWVV